MYSFACSIDNSYTSTFYIKLPRVKNVSRMKTESAHAPDVKEEKEEEKYPKEQHVRQQQQQRDQEEDEDEEEEEEDILMRVKEIIDKYIKPLALKIGCFMDLYNLFSHYDDDNCDGNVIIPFVRYCNQFSNEKDFFLLTKHGENGETLFDACNRKSNKHLVEFLNSYGRFMSNANDGGSNSMNDTIMDKTLENEQSQLSKACDKTAFVCCACYVVYVSCLLVRIFCKFLIGNINRNNAKIYSIHFLTKKNFQNLILKAHLSRKC